MQSLERKIIVFKSLAISGKRIDIQIGRKIIRQIEAHRMRNRQRDRQADRYIDPQRDRQTDRQIDRQIDAALKHMSLIDGRFEITNFQIQGTFVLVYFLVIQCKFCFAFIY